MDTGTAAAAKIEDNETALREAEKILSGGDSYTDRAMLVYLLNLMKHTPIHTPAAYRFCMAAKAAFSDDDMKKIGFPAARGDARARGRKKTADVETDTEEQKINPKLYPSIDKPPHNGVLAQDWDNLHRYLEGRLSKMDDVEEPTVLRNMMRLSGALGLDADAGDVLRFLYVGGWDYEFDKFVTAFSDGNREMLGVLVSRCVDNPVAFKRFGRLLGNESPLIRFGLFNLEPDSIRTYLPVIDDDLADLLSSRDIEDDDLLSGVIGKPVETDLTYNDFSFIGRDLEFIADLVGKAAQQGQTGINILIYGPPGSGKTEMAKALAKKLDLKMYSIGEEGRMQSETRPLHDSDGDYIGTSTVRREEEKTSKMRLSQLLRAQALLKGNPAAVVLFDEMEDLLVKGEDADSKINTDSKIQINRVLETNPVVTIWTGNDTDKFHEAVRQRFTFSLYLDYPPTLVRRKMWERHLSLQGVKLQDDEVTELARKYDAAPRMIAKAVRAAAITGGGMAAIETSMPASSKVSYKNSEALSAAGRVTRAFNPELIALKGGDEQEKLAGLIARGAARKPFALMVDGPRGAGANTMLRYVAEQMTMNTMEVSMKDLAQPGMQTAPEDHVRMVFSAAAEGRKFLILTDIEHMVPDPQSAGAQWEENTLVDAFARAVRRHKLPFAVTSRSSHIEFPPAVTHLFSDRLTVTTLDPARAASAFTHYFDRDAPEKLPEGLTVADFANVKRLLTRLPEQKTSTGIAAMLAEQQRYRTAERQLMGLRPRS